MTNLVIDNPVRHKRCKHEHNFANDFNFFNCTIMKAATMPQFGIVEATRNQLWWTTVIQ